MNKNVGMVAAAGYSGKPVAAKLGIKNASRVLLLDAPDNYAQLIGTLPQDVRFDNRASHAVDIAHVFATRKESLLTHLVALRKTLRPDAAIWVSWPKKSAKISTDISEDTIRELALPLGFVDIKVCAVSEIWSGLKLVVRKELR